MNVNAPVITRNKMKNKIKVEEDGDDVFPPMPKKCVIPSCKKAKIVVNSKGYYVCSKCGCSYGKKEKK